MEFVPPLCEHLGVLCRAQFSTALRRAVDLAAKIDKDGPDRATDMQVLRILF